MWLKAAWHRSRFLNATAPLRIENSDDYSATVIMQQDWWCTHIMLFCVQTAGFQTAAVIITLRASRSQNARWPLGRRQTKAAVREAMKTNSLRSHQRSSDKGSALGGTLSRASKTNTRRFSCTDTAFCVIRPWRPLIEGTLCWSFYINHIDHVIILFKHIYTNICVCIWQIMKNNTVNDD